MGLIMSIVGTATVAFRLLTAGLAVAAVASTALTIVPTIVTSTASAGGILGGTVVSLAGAVTARFGRPLLGLLALLDSIKSSVLHVLSSMIGGKQKF